MNINGLGNQLNVGGQQKTQKESNWSDKIFRRFQENIENRKRDSFEKSNEELMGMILGNYEYYNIKTINRIKESGQVEMKAVVEAAVRNISYEESDHVQVNVAEGYTYRAQVDVSNHSVYLEYRDDEGAVKAYVAEVPSISKDTENPIEQMALASWNKVLEENRRALGFTEYQNPILAGDTIPGKYVNGCFVSEMKTYEDTIYLGKFGDACGMAALFGGSWSEYYPMEKGNQHPESIEVKLFSGRTVIVDVDRVSQITQLKGVLSKAEYAQLEEALEQETGSVRMPQEKWDQLLKTTDDSLEVFREHAKTLIKEEEEATCKPPKLKVPYSELVNENGVIEYNGVVFTCDEEKNAICLGDMSNMDNVLIIPLSNGGSLYVNRQNFSDLARAITMFSAEDRNRIMRAIQKDKKVQQLKQEIEDEKASVGEIQDKGDGEVQSAEQEQSKDAEQEQTLAEEADGDSQILVKPDGTRILMVTTKIGAIETTMSIELSKPTQLQDDEKQRGKENQQGEEKQQSNGITQTELGETKTATNDIGKM